MKPRAVIFDLFGTVVRTFQVTAFEDSLKVMAACLDMEHGIFFQAWTTETNIKRHTGAFPSIRAEIEWICSQHQVKVSDTKLDKAVEARKEFTRNVLIPRPDAVPTLTALKKKGIKTGLISDCSHEVPELWPETPFNGLFDAPIFSCCTGTKKPDPKIYGMACEQLGVKGEECFYVGDGYSNELAGARSCGMRAFILAPPDEENPDTSYWKWDPWDGEKLGALSEVLKHCG